MAKKATNTLDALEFLLTPTAAPVGPVCVIAGDDAFLCHETRVALLHRLTQAGEQSDADLAIETRDGRKAELRDVLDVLSELSLFGAERRVVVVEGADPFVKQYRERLEQYVAQPAHDALLVLEVSTWPSNTRLAKAVSKTGLTIRCQVPQQGRELTAFNKRLKDWLIHCAKQEFAVEMQRGAADLLLELLPTQVGVLYQEVLKLSLLVGDRGKIDAELVRENVGGWRARKTWDMIDAAADGRAADALNQLDRLLAAGEEPHALLPQMASTLRRFAAAVRLFERAEKQGRSTSLRSALQQAGMPPFKLNDAEAQLRQIGRPRAKQLYHWLLAADLGLKGFNSTKARARRVLETLIIRLAKQAAPPVPVSSGR